MDYWVILTRWPPKLYRLELNLACSYTPSRRPLGWHTELTALTGAGAPTRAESKEDTPEGHTGQTLEPC